MDRATLKMMLGVGVVSLIVLSGCSSHPSIYGAEASGDGKTLYLEIAA